MSLFEDKNISPMLLSQEFAPFDSEYYIFELKLDGIRCIAYLDSNYVLLQNKRYKVLNDIYPELMDICSCVDKKCILDGELVCIDERGKPNFQNLQQRALLADAFKIRLKMDKFKVSFVAYDILYLGDKDLTSLPLVERKKILEKAVRENDKLSISRYIDKFGKKLFELTKRQGLEGIVAKLKTSTYQIGKRSKDWIKIKNLIDEDFYICGYILDDKGNIKDLALCKEVNGKFVDQGNIYYGAHSYEQRLILE